MPYKYYKHASMYFLLSSPITFYIATTKCYRQKFIDNTVNSIHDPKVQSRWPVFDEDLLVVWNSLRGPEMTQSMLCCVMKSTDNILRQTIDYDKPSVRINTGWESYSWNRSITEKFNPFLNIPYGLSSGSLIMETQLWNEFWWGYWSHSAYLNRFNAYKRITLLLYFYLQSVEHPILK